MDEELQQALEEADRVARTRVVTPAPSRPKPQADQAAKAPQKDGKAGPYDGSAGAVTGRLGRSFTGGFLGTLALPTDIVGWAGKKLFGEQAANQAMASARRVTVSSGSAGSGVVGAVGSAIIAYAGPIRDLAAQERAEFIAKKGDAQGFAERAANTGANFAGGSAIPFLGFLSWGRRITAGVGVGLQSRSAIVRFLARGAEATAKNPGIALAGEAGAAIAGGIGQTAAEDEFPDSPGIQLAAGIGSAVLGGGLGSIVAATGKRLVPTTGSIDDSLEVVGWRDTGEGQQEPILAFKDTPAEEVVEAGAKAKKTQAMEAEDPDLVTLTAPDPDLPPGAPPKDITVGTMGRADLAALEADVAGFAGRRAGNPRDVDITWETSPQAADRAGEWRLGNLGDSNDSVSLLAALTRQLPAQARKTDAELMATAGKAAEDIGEDADAIMALGKQIAGTLGDADTAIATLRSVWGNQSREVSAIGLANVDWTTASEQLVVHAAESIRNLSVLSQMVQEAKAGLGRGLRAIQLPDAATYQASVRKALEEVSEDGATQVSRSEAPTPGLPTSKEEIKDWFDLWKMTDGDPTKQAAMLQGLLTVPSASKYLRQSFANFFTASILSAPRTVALNIIGPGSVSVIRQIERTMGAGVNSLNPLLSRGDRLAARAVATSAGKAYLQTFGDIQDAFKQALRAAERNHTIIGGGGQTMDSLTTFGPFSEGLLRATGRAPSMAYSLGNFINAWPRAFARLNNGLDEFAKRMAYQGEVRTNAMVEAATQGLKGQEAADFVKKAMQGAYDEVGHAADEAMLRSAERTTLTSQIGEAGSKTRFLGNVVQKMRGEVPELRYLLPVFNVPVNALGETLRRLPIAAIPGVNRVIFRHMAKELAGELGPVQQADAYGRMMLGSSFLMAGMMMNRSGTLTGSGPRDPVDRKVWLQTHQPYSIRIGDEWVRYDKFDILGGLLSIPATVMDATTYHPDDQSAQDIAFAGVGALAQWFKDRAALRNATGLLALGEDPTKDTGDVFRRVTGNIASGFFPAAIRTLVTDQMHPYQTMKTSWGDYIKSVIPGVAEEVEPLRNVLGEPIKKGINTIPEALLPISTVSAVTFKDNPVLDELDRLYQETGYGAGADSSALGYGFFAPQELKLEDGKSLYYHGMQMRQTMKDPRTGWTLQQALGNVIASSRYANGVDADSQTRKTSRGELSRGYMVREVFGRYNDLIKAELASKSPKARAYLTAAAAKRKDDAYLRDTPIEDLVADPRLYQMKGINQGAVERKLLDGRPAQNLLNSLGQ